MKCRLRLTERIQAFEKIQRQISETKSIKSCKSHRSESVVSSRSARSKSARLRAEMESLEHEKEIRQLQLLKGVSITDAEEKAFKRVIKSKPICAQNFRKTIILKSTQISRLTVVFMNVRTLIQITLVFMTNMFSFLRTNNI